jgi:hypothetical protein
VTGAFPSDVLELLAREEEVRIETSRPDGSTRRTIIWVVVDGQDVFIRSVEAERGRWYQRLKARPEAVLHAAGQAIPVRAEPAKDDDSVERCSRALREKYTGISGLREMLVAETLPTTTRLLPA